MKYAYAVKHNGVLYPAGADVPVGETPKKVIETPKAAEAKEEKKPEPKPAKASTKKK